MTWMIALAMAAQAATPAPSAAAEALGLRLAQTSTLATIAPILVAKDSAELVAAHPELSDAEKTLLRATATRIGTASTAQLNAAFGHAYAARLSIAELRALVAHAESPAARHWRKILPGAMADAMSSASQIDLKAEAMAAFCKATGKLCPAQK